MTAGERVQLSPARRLKRAIQLLDAGKPAAAIKDFTAVLEQDTLHFLALLYRGDAHWQLRALPAAVSDWRSAALKNEISHLPYTRIGAALSETGRHHEALAEFAVGIKKAPSDPRGWNGRGITRFHMRDFVGAVDDYTKAIRRGQRVPADVRALFWANRAEAELQLGDVVAALKDAKKAATLDASDEFVASILRAATRAP